MSFSKAAPAIQCEAILSPTNTAGKTGYRKLEAEIGALSHTKRTQKKITLKWIKDLTETGN